MANEIERLLYEDRSTHGVSEFTVSRGLLRLRLVPWSGPRVVTIAEFNKARISSVDVYPDKPDDLDMPWDVLGFDCYELEGGRWKFVLHCTAIEWCFESRWPTVTRVLEGCGLA